MFSNVFFCILAFLPCASWTLRADVAACSCAATACARRGWSWALRVLEDEAWKMMSEMQIGKTCYMII
jgi:hypothetical protein